MRSNRRGFALMAALWLVVLLGITSWELSVRGRTRRLAVANALEGVQAEAAAEAALESARAILEWLLARSADARVPAADAMLDPLGGLAFIRPDTISLGDERATFSLYDAGARLQVNRASEQDIRRLLVALRFDSRDADAIAQRIADWRDADSFPRLHGAERDDYLRAGARVLPADADFASVEELRSVDGVTPAYFARMSPFVSVFGSGQVNLATAPPEVLASLPGMGAEAIAVIIRSRQERRPMRSLAELADRLSPGARRALQDAGADLSARAAFETREVVVTSEGWVDGSPVRAHGEAVYARAGDALLGAWRRVTR